MSLEATIAAPGVTTAFCGEIDGAAVGVNDENDDDDDDDDDNGKGQLAG